jgi:hypothetical protein
LVAMITMFAIATTVTLDTIVTFISIADMLTKITSDVTIKKWKQTRHL